MLTISLFIDERLTLSFLAIDAISGLTRMVLRSITAAVRRKIRVGGLTNHGRMCYHIAKLSWGVQRL